MRSCIICGKTEQQLAAEQVAAGFEPEGFSMKSQGEPWCDTCHLFYDEHRQHFHPIQIVGHQRFGPPSWGAAGMAPLHKTLPAYLTPQNEWAQIGFDVDKMRRMMQGQPTQQPQPAPQGGSVTQYQTTMTESARIALQLQHGMGSDGGALSDEERARLEARQRELQQPAEVPTPVQTPSVFDQIMAQEAERAVEEGAASYVEQATSSGEIDGTVGAQSVPYGLDPAVGLRSSDNDGPLGSVTVEETGEQISFVEAASRLYGLNPEQVADLERMRQKGDPAAQVAHDEIAEDAGLKERPNFPPPPPAREGWAIPDLTEQEADDFLDAIGGHVDSPMTAEQAVEAVMEVLQEVNDPDVVKQLFLGLLEAQDPTDSDVTLAMWQHLQNVQRVFRIGSLDVNGLTGYTYFYSEPKGSTREGYTPGGTQGARMVDKAKEQIAASGAAPVEKGMCPGCMKTVRKENGTIVTDLDGTAECAGGGAHEIV